MRRESDRDHVCLGLYQMDPQPCEATTPSPLKKTKIKTRTQPRSNQWPSYSLDLLLAWTQERGKEEREDEEEEVEEKKERGND